MRIRKYISVPVYKCDTWDQPKPPEKTLTAWTTPSYNSLIIYPLKSNQSRPKEP